MRAITFAILCLLFINVSCEKEKVPTTGIIEPNDSTMLKQIFRFAPKDNSYSVTTKYTWSGRQLSLEETSWTFQGHKLAIKSNQIAGTNEFQIDNTRAKFSRNFYFSDQQQDQYIEFLKMVVAKNIDSLLISYIKSSPPLVALPSLNQFSKYFSKELHNEIQDILFNKTLQMRVSQGFDLETGQAGCKEDTGFCPAEYSYCVTCEYDPETLPYTDCWGNHAQRISKCIAEYNSCITSCWESGQLEQLNVFTKRVKSKLPSIVEVPIIVLPFDCGCTDERYSCETFAWQIFRWCLAKDRSRFTWLH